MSNLDSIYKGLAVFLDTPSGKIIGGWIYLIIPILLSIKPVKNFFDDIKKSRIKTLQMVLLEGENYLENNTKKFLKGNLEEEYFKLATGLYLSKGFQNAMMDLYDNDNCNVSFDHFKRASGYMKYDSLSNKIINVKIHWLETLFGLLFVFSGFLLVFMMIALAFTILLWEKSWSFLILLIMMWVLFFIGLVMIGKPYSIYNSCKNVQRKIDPNQTVCFYQRVSKKPKEDRSLRYYWERWGRRLLCYISTIGLSLSLVIYMYLDSR